MRTLRGGDSVLSFYVVRVRECPAAVSPPLLLCPCESETRRRNLSSPLCREFTRDSPAHRYSCHLALIPHERQREKRSEEPHTGQRWGGEGRHPLVSRFPATVYKLLPFTAGHQNTLLAFAPMLSHAILHQDTTQFQY